MSHAVNAANADLLVLALGLPDAYTNLKTGNSLPSSHSLIKKHHRTTPSALTTPETSFVA